MVDSTKQAAIVAAADRRMQYEQLVAAKLAEQRRIKEERVARELAERAEQEKIEVEAKRQQQAEAERLVAEKAVKDKSEVAEAAAIHEPGTSSEARSGDGTRLDAVEQRMEKFSEEQEDMKKEMQSHGALLKLILERLPEKRS